MENQSAVQKRRAEGLDITLSDIMSFTDWMEDAHRAVTEGGSFPHEPSLESHCVKTWVRVFSTLHRRWLEAGSHRMLLEAQLQIQESHLARLATTLYENIGSLHDSLGYDGRAKDARERAASCVQAFKLRGKEVA